MFSDGAGRKTRTSGASNIVDCRWALEYGKRRSSPRVTYVFGWRRSQDQDKRSLEYHRLSIGTGIREALVKSEAYPLSMGNGRA